MPFRDHFRPPIWDTRSWEGFHGGWPMTMVQRLVPHLPRDYTAEPRVHLGKYFEIDICAFEEEAPLATEFSSSDDSGGVATATATTTIAAPHPTFTVEADMTDEYAYEVRLYYRDRYLVAAVEIVSPGNKDRRESRRAFVTKCADLIQQGVCVSIVDLVTIRHFNLYAEILEHFNWSDPAFALKAPNVYAVTCRARKVGDTGRFESWAHPLAVGQPLPTLPIWLSESLMVQLELEASYEETCKVLRIG